MTAHKAQGKSLDVVMMDLESTIGTEAPYVMLSRATSLEGVFILRPFQKKVIQRHPSQDVRDEFRRLDVLCHQSIMQYGTADEGTEAQEYLVRTFSAQALPNEDNLAEPMDLDVDVGARRLATLQATNARLIAGGSGPNAVTSQPRATSFVSRRRVRLTKESVVAEAPIRLGSTSARKRPPEDVGSSRPKRPRISRIPSSNNINTDVALAAPHFPPLSFPLPSLDLPTMYDGFVEEAEALGDTSLAAHEIDRTFFRTEPDYKGNIYYEKSDGTPFMASFVAEIGSDAQGTWLAAYPKKTPPFYKLATIYGPPPELRKAFRNGAAVVDGVRGVDEAQEAARGETFEVTEAILYEQREGDPTDNIVVLARLHPTFEVPQGSNNSSAPRTPRRRITKVDSTPTDASDDPGDKSGACGNGLLRSLHSLP
ncbi:hypothetical protein B0H11DRAFT_2224657 [Mycena galericulata]|nr:hypothetical protein B0H11DRAFT_2224657 [Mycena galericulata]